MQYEHMEMYEHFSRDPNKERAVDHFLILNKLKDKAAVYASNADIQIPVRADAPDETGCITLRRSTWGYLDVTLQAPEAAKWLKLTKERLTSADFNENGEAEVFFIVLPKLLTMKRQTARVAVLAEGLPVDEIRITAARHAGVTAKADREFYGFADAGKLLVSNRTGADLAVEIYAADSFVKFDHMKYPVGETAAIPFSIELSGLQTVQAALRKRAFMESEVQVRWVSGGKYYREFVRLRISGLE